MYIPINECFQCFEDYLTLVESKISAQSASILAKLIHITEPSNLGEVVANYLRRIR